MIKQIYYVLKGNNEDWFPIINGTLRGKVKLIYLDPPYNTKRARGMRKGFSDNNTDWGKMMLNVLVKAYEYLAEDGFLAISINQTELFNLKIVLDEVFKGERRFVGLFPVQIRHVDRQLMINATFHDVYEYMLIYRKNPSTRFYTENAPIKLDKFVYKIEIIDDSPLQKNIGGKNIEIYDETKYQLTKTRKNKDCFRRYIISGKIATANWSGEFYERHLKKLGQNKLIKVIGLDKRGLGYRWFLTSDGKRKSGIYFQSTKTAGKPKLLTNHINLMDIVPNIYREGGEGINFTDSKKPEILLKMLIEHTTKKGDIIMDLFGGSGTTISCAVKTDRSCITIEKNSDFVNIIQKRLNNLKSGKDIDLHKYPFQYSILKSREDWYKYGKL